MSYKIVSIPTKRGKADISLCPSGWEYQNIVRWPPKMLNILQMDPHSQPEDDWKPYKCVVKRANIRSYEEAVDWESMYENIDTDSEQNFNTEQYRPVIKTKTMQKPHTISSNNVQTFNSLFSNIGDENEVTSAVNTTPVVLQNQQEICSSQPITHLDISQKPIITSIVAIPSQRSAPSTQQAIPDRPLDIANTPMIVANSADDLSSFLIPSTWDSEAFNTMKNDLQQFKEQVKKDLKVIQERQVANDARVATATDKVLSTLNEIKSLMVNISSNQNVSVDPQIIDEHLADGHGTEEDFLTKYPLPILELNELKKFDAELHGSRHFNDFWIEHFGNIFGKDGKNKKGEIVGKKISEMIISKSLLSQISYTGVSRTTGIKVKYALQKLESLLALITTATKNADDRWDTTATVELFSNKLLKHSRKRQLAHELKIQRMGKKAQQILPVVDQDRDVDGVTEADEFEASAELAVSLQAEPTVPNQIELAVRNEES